MLLIATKKRRKKKKRWIRSMGQNLSLKAIGMFKVSFIWPTPDDNSVANSKSNKKKRLKKSKSMKAQLLK